MNIFTFLKKPWLSGVKNTCNLKLKDLNGKQALRKLVGLKGLNGLKELKHLSPPEPFDYISEWDASRLCLLLAKDSRGVFLALPLSKWGEPNLQPPPYRFWAS